jgi:predicted HicB family RNase H-like nuclease
VLTLINIKIDPKMKSAIQKAADKQFISMSAFIKQAIEKHLQEQGIDWRQEKPEKKPKR